MRRIIISVAIGIVAAGMLALPAVSASAASAAPSAAVSKSAWPPPHDHQAECNTITDDIYRLENDNIWLDDQLVQAERGGYSSTTRRITDQIDANKTQIDRDIQRSVDANCGSLPGRQRQPAG